MNFHYVRMSSLLPLSVHVIFSIRYTVWYNIWFLKYTLFCKFPEKNFYSFPQIHLSFLAKSRHPLSSSFYLYCTSRVLVSVMHTYVVEGGRIACSGFEFGSTYRGPYRALQRWLLHRKALTIISCSFHPIFFCRTRLSKKDSATTPASDTSSSIRGNAMTCHHCCRNMQKFMSPNHRNLNFL